MRGGEFYKRRHWEAKHKHENPSLSLKYIVPSNHEDAKKLMKDKPKEPDHEIPKPQRLNLTKTTDDIVNIISSKSKTSIESETTQKSIAGFLLHDDEDSQEKEDNLVKMQSDINQIKLMLSSLSLMQIGRDDVKIENTGDWGIKDANNMKDINHDDISIEILDDGCKVTCIVCQTFFHLNSSRRLIYYHTAILCMLNSIIVNSIFHASQIFFCIKVLM